MQSQVISTVEIHNMQSQSFDFRIGKSTVSSIIRETCDGICQAFLENYLTAPESTEDWLRIAEDFKMNGTSPIALEPLMVNIFAWNALEMVALHFIITKIFTVWY